MQKIGWFFPDENAPSDRYVDEFADSKFSIDRWVSFTREIIQNSLDVSDIDLDPREPVLVKMEYGCFNKRSIPGCIELENCIKKALKGAMSKNSNKQTISRYKKGLEVLGSDHIYCVKVSDYKTIGVTEGRDYEWGALVFDEGKSLKHRPGSAGSHGVGKKAPFIISSVNTVFYSTFNKHQNYLFQGKTSLINWEDEDGKTKNGKGWYGLVDEEINDRRNKVLPLSKEMVKDIDPFFFRKEECGTDVIVVGVPLDDITTIKEKIINSVLENFFVAIKNQKLELDIFGEHIVESNLDEYVSKYYITNRKNFTKIEGIEKSVFGNLLNYYKAFLTEPTQFDVVDQGTRYGRCSVYFSLENDKNRKYYCIFRNHGMKIRDVEMSNAEQPFSAVLLIDDCPEDTMADKDRLNARLSDTENAAHDDFVIDDDEFECDPITKRLVVSIYDKVKNIILDKTKIEASSETPLEGLDEMLSIQGVLTTKLSNKKVKIKKRKNRIKKKGLGKKAEDYEEGVTSVGGNDKKKRRFGFGFNKPAIEGGNLKSTLFKKYSKEPIFVRNNDGFDLILNPTENAVADIKIMPISVDGSVNYIPNLIRSAEYGRKRLSVKDNVIKDVKLHAGQTSVISIKITHNYNYALECDTFVGGGKND